MRKFNLSRTGGGVVSPIALAWWPFVAALACNVYDDSLSTMAPLGGSGSQNGDAGSDSAGTGGTSDGGSVGGGAGSGASAGNDTGGGAGDSPASGAGGTGGTSSGSSGSAGTAGTSAGGTGAGGTAGTGGTPMNGDGELVDDMEDDDAEIMLVHGRNGYWYTGSDTTAGAVLTPPSNKFAMTMLAAGDRSDFAASVKAENFTGWGSDIGFNFVELSGPQAYDASAYCGVRFWGKAAAAVTMRFRVPDASTHPAGMICKDPGAPGTACYDHFGSAVAFGKVWNQFSFKFSELTQIGNGYHPASGKLDTKKLYAVEWALPGGATAKTYQIWIDDVELLKCP